MRHGGSSYWTGKVELVVEHLWDPLKWKEPTMVFVNSMADIFHEKLSDIEIAEIIAVMALAHWHTFQTLTKRPDRQKELLSDPEFWQTVRDMMLMTQADWNEQHKPRAQLAIAGMEVPLRNWWVGVSIEDQPSADYVRPFILETPAYIRWLSMEPLLGDIDLTDYFWKFGCEPHCGDRCSKDADCPVELRGLIHWGVAGAESGVNARDANLDWFRGVRDQFVKAGAAFHLKQFAVNGIKIHTPELDGKRWLQYPEGR